MGENAGNSGDCGASRQVWAALLACVPAQAHAGAGSAVVPLAAMAAGAAIALGAVALGRWWAARDRMRTLRQAVAAGADWRWRCDASLAVAEVDPGRRPLDGFDPRALVGRKPWELDGTAQAPAALLAAVRAQAPFFDVPVALGSGASARLFLLSASPLAGPGGRFDGYSGVARELTAAVAALRGAPADPGETARQEAEQAERTRQLELAVRELDSFSHSVSHDLRAPLRVVDGFANIVLEDYGERLDDLGREHLKRIVAAGSRMNSMIDTLLAMSRMTSREIERERVDLARLARELADELRAQDPQRSVEFVIPDRVVVDGDRTLLRLVLQNLLGNAWKFSARVAQPRVEFGVADDGGRRIYFVRDNGAGFDMRFADKLFGLFQRFHSSNEFPGTGVGLATVQRIVRKHGGRIWAESQPGQGATFSFTLWDSGRAG